MDHVAIMKKSLGLLPKIITGEKTVESRFYNSRRAPWGKIKAGDRIFFKNSGELVTVSAKVSQVLLNPENIADFKHAICLGTLPNKKYSILIFLTEAKKVEPFQIAKKGFGAMSAWVMVDNIDTIRV